MALWYDKKAYTLLKKCSDARDFTKWNRYREETNHAPINLRFANLKDFYLLDADLRDVDFRGAYLLGAQFDGADVSGANIDMGFSAIIYISFLIIFGVIFFFLKTIPIDLVNKNFILPSFLVYLFALLLTMWRRIYLAFLLFSIGIGIFASFITLIIFVKSLIGDNPLIMFLIVLISLMYFVPIAVIFKKVQKSISKAINPLGAIGFQKIFFKEPINELQYIKKEIREVNKLLDEKKKSKKDRAKLEERLKILLNKEKIAMDEQENSRRQQRKINRVLEHFLKPYAYIEKNIFKLKLHNGWFYFLIFLIVSLSIYVVYNGYIVNRERDFSLVLGQDSITFGSLFGVILFYATPILFGMSIIVYSIAQINKNIQSIEAMQEQKRSIEVLQSTLLAQTEIADVSDDEIKALIQALQKGALEKMFGKDKPTEKTPKEKSTYREKLLITNLSKALTQALK